MIVKAVCSLSWRLANGLLCTVVCTKPWVFTDCRNRCSLLIDCRWQNWIDSNVFLVNLVTLPDHWFCIWFSEDIFKVGPTRSHFTLPEPFFFEIDLVHWQLVTWECLGFVHSQGGSESWFTDSNNAIASLAFHPTAQLLLIATANEIHFWDWSRREPFAVVKTASEMERVRWALWAPAVSGLDLTCGEHLRVLSPQKIDCYLCITPAQGRGVIPVALHAF